MSSNNEDLVEDFPPGPLDEYRKLASFDWKKMKFFLEDSDLLEIKMKVWDVLESDPLFARSVVEPTTEEMKRVTALRLHKYYQFGLVPPDISKWAYRRMVKYLMTVNEALNITFPDVCVKHAIGNSLVRNALTKLGTERHQHILDALWDNKLLASIAITEIAHGSNTKQVRTIATYDPKTQEFIINTPDFEAAKCWIGNAGKTCTATLLYAQLYTNGQCHGLHVFFVQIRDPKTLIPYPGIIVGDMGEKIALHGIDNGFMIFKDYRIPRENLLNRTADVTPEGEYESTFSEPGRILGAALEQLSTGRVGIMQECSNNLINAVTIAVRYAAVRRQFGRSFDDAIELPLLEYQLHQWRLFPLVSATVVLRQFVLSFTDDYLDAVEQSTSSEKIGDLTDLVAEIHATVSCAKPLVSWTSCYAIQECREACGGHGFLKAARFGDLKGAVEACITYEGDNNVLVQQTSNWLLRNWNHMVKTGEPPKSPLGGCSLLQNHREILARKFNGNSVKDILTTSFVQNCYEWLVTYLVRETYERQQLILEKNGNNRIDARNNTQVYKAAVLSKAFGEYIALSKYWKKISTADSSLRTVLEQLGILYGLFNLDKHIAYFYQGNFTNTPQFSTLLKDGILEICAILKPNILAVIDAIAPPDYALNSVLGKADGKLYQHLETMLFHNPDAMSRPEWWKDIIIKDAPDFMKIKSKL